MEQTARYILLGSLKYAARDGEMNDAQFIEMHAPTGRHTRQVAHLRQSIVKAIVEDNDKQAAADALSGAAGSSEPAPAPIVDEDEGEATVASGIDLINIMARSTVDLGALYKVARDLFVLKGVLKLDAEINMTQTLLDNMTAQDFEHLVGAYIANFTLPS